MILVRLCMHESPGIRHRPTHRVDRRFAASVAMYGPWPKRASCVILKSCGQSDHVQITRARFRSVLGVPFCIVLAYRMEQSGNSDDVTDLDNPEVDVGGMIAEVGAGPVATVQGQPLGRVTVTCC